MNNIVSYESMNNNSLKPSLQKHKRIQKRKYTRQQQSTKTEGIYKVDSRYTNCFSCTIINFRESFRE